MALFDRLGRDGPRVVFVGIDGVPYSLIQSEPDVFPTLTGIIEAGSGTPIDSIVPPESSACWPALTTGKNPGETGVYGFQERRPNSYETYVPRGPHVSGERVWDRVQEAGRNATVLNVPVTYPPQTNVQRMVSGFLSPGIEDAAHPSGIARTVRKYDYHIDVDARLGHREDKAAFFAAAHATLEARAKTFAHFIERDDWDLFFGVFMTPDRVNHFAFGDYESGGPNREAFLKFYRALDDAIGRLYEALPADVPLVVASDHGFTTLEYEFDANAWLERNGWLSYDTSEPSSLTDITPESRAYALVPGRFYLNLEGREPAGNVPVESSDSVRRELRRDLEAIRGPDGRPVIDRVLTREEAFSGNHTDRAPDLVAIPRDGFDLKAGFDGATQVFSTGPRNGMHTVTDATLIVDRPVDLPSHPDILDVAPVLLDYLALVHDGHERQKETVDESFTPREPRPKE